MTSTLTETFRPALEQALDGLQKSSGHGRSAALEPCTRAELAEAVRARIDFDDVRGAQVGNNNVQLNRLIAQAPRLGLSFEEALQRHSVVTAIQNFNTSPTTTVCGRRL